MRKRRSSGGDSPINFFSFQDIITSLVGILVILTLVMAIGASIPKTIPPIESKHETAPVSIPDVINNGSGKFDDARKTVKDIELGDLLIELKHTYGKLEDEYQGFVEELNVKKMQLRDISENKNIFFIPGKSDKTPLIVECSQSSMIVGTINNQSQPVAFTSNTEGFKNFSAYMLTRKKEYEYFVIMIKPSGADWAMSLVDIIQNAGFDVGYDALEEEKSVAFGTQQ